MLDAVPATPTVAAVTPDAGRGAARRRAPHALVAAALLGPLAILLPVGFTLYRAATLGAQDALDLLWRPLVGELLVNTLLITLAATLACAVLGTAVAWCVERTTLPLRPLWAALAAAPLAVPPFVTSYAWVSISLDLQDFLGALIVLSAAYFPLVYLPVAAALRELDPALEESARTHAGMRSIQCIACFAVLPARGGGWQIAHALRPCNSYLCPMNLPPQRGHGVICRIPPLKKRTSVHARVRSSCTSMPACVQCSRYSR
ncbi:hypothetical protein WJ58_14725 [Burkholderia ubonensis]|nr:hypothetical protein WJ58_14725 [Burkholderia ubonensis]